MTQPSARILVLADDLTGLSEIACLAAERGATSVLHTRPGAYRNSVDPPSSIAMVNLACRRSSGLRAKETLTNLFDSLRAARPGAAMDPHSPADVRESPRIYLKVDSVARGPIAWMLQGLLDVFGPTGIPLLLANPAQQRTTHDGAVFVGGTPLHESPFRDDPIHPATESFLPKLLTRDLDLCVETGDQRTDTSRSTINILDGASTIDVEKAAQRWNQARVAAGAAPFGVELIRTWHDVTPGPVDARGTPDFSRTLAVVGTRHPTADALADDFRRRGGTVCRCVQPPTAPKLPLLIRPPRALGDPEAVLESLTAAAVWLYRSLNPSTLFLVGGETAQSLTDALRITHAFPVRYTCQTAHLRCDTRREGLPRFLLMKPGSYDGEDLLGGLFGVEA